MRTLRQKILISLFITIFLMTAVIQLLFERQDWPFSRFGMYSGNFVGVTLKKNEITFFTDGKNGKTYYEHDNSDWLSRQLRALNEDKILENGFPEFLAKPLHAEALRLMDEHTLPSIKLRIRLLLWSEVREKNYTLPDKSIVLLDREYENYDF